MKKFMQMMPFWQCTLCQKPAGELLCNDCQKSLPWRENPCWLCATELPSTTQQICGACLKKPPPWRQLVAPWRFEPPITQLVHRFKFNFHPHLAAYLAKLASPYMQAFYDLEPVELIVPVPLHRLRQSKRLYNQSDWIAHTLAKKFDCPLDTHSLRRIRHTRAQAKMTNPIARRRNIQAAFQAKNPPTATRIALVDDVCTSGATASACIRTWQQVTPAKFSLWCLARADAKRYS